MWPTTRSVILSGVRRAQSVRRTQSTHAIYKAMQFTKTAGTSSNFCGAFPALRTVFREQYLAAS